MKKKSLKIDELKVESFITSIKESNQLKGGRFSDPVPDKYEISKRVVMTGCWASEPTGPKDI